MANWSNLQQPNVGLLFYKQIYKEREILNRLEIDGKELKIEIRQDEKTTPFDSFYKSLYQTKANKNDYIKPPTKGLLNFDLYTTYPGLLCGSGYGHDTGAKGDFKIGFFFDHTTGQPIIPGSSVKGVLRSLFECDVDEKGNEKTGEKSVEALQFIFKEVLDVCSDDGLRSKLTETQNTISDAASLNKIKTIIFGGQDQIGADTFFDAVINFEELGNQQFLSNDFITPHSDPLKNPVPLMFLKVLPNVPFQFRFKLGNEGWSVKVKQAIFKTILLTIGAGAKTNVGYGQFVEQENRVKTTELKSSGGGKQANQQGGGRQQGNRNQLIKPIQSGPGLQTKLDTNLAIPENLQAQITKASYGKIIRGDEVYGQIVKSDRKFYYVKILIEENNELITNVQQSKKWKKLPVGMVLLLKVTSVTNKDKIDCSINKKIIE